MKSLETYNTAEVSYTLFCFKNVIYLLQYLNILFYFYFNKIFFMSIIILIFL